MLSDEHRVNPVVASNGGTDAVVAWQTITGDPVEVRTRRNAGAWSPVHLLGGENARDPAVAMTPDGTAFVALQTYDTDHRARVGVSSDADGWRTTTYVSPLDVTARTPSIGFDTTGRGIAVWQVDRSTTSTEIQVAERSPSGTWSEPRALSAPGRVGTPHLAVASDGSAVVSWHGQAGRRSRIWAATRRADGTWTDAAPLSSSVSYAVDPGVAALRDGDAAVSWIEVTGDAAKVDVARTTDGEWEPPTTVDTADEGPREMSRPGRAEMAPALAYAPDGRLTVAWATTRNGTTQVSATRTDADGRLVPKHALSRPGEQAGGVTAARAPGGATIIGWEEIDHDLLRARVRIGDARCRDLAPPDGESGGVRMAGGTAPVAVYIDLNRGRIMGVDLT